MHDIRAGPEIAPTRELPDFRSHCKNPLIKTVPLIDYSVMHA